MDVNSVIKGVADGKTEKGLAQSWEPENLLKETSKIGDRRGFFSRFQTPFVNDDGSAFCPFHSRAFAGVSLQSPVPRATTASSR